MTQAIELSKILNSNGHEVVHTFIGKSKRRVVPDYFFEQIESTAETLSSPNFILDKENKSLDLAKSITHNARFLYKYQKSLHQIHRKVKETNPDVLVNFYDFLGGFYFRIYNPQKLKHVCIGRQFLVLHVEYPFITGREIEKKLYLINNKITSQKCDKYLALSFRPYHPLKFNNVVVVPPLIKEEIRTAQVEKEDFILGYMVNDGYAEEIIAWHKTNPEIKIHCFWDRKNMAQTYVPQTNLVFHQINYDLFSDLMRRCKGYVSTAGFESICEAMYLQKPVLMIPVARQYEQACNAIDAELAGAGIIRDSFDISSLIDFMPKYTPNTTLRSWFDITTSVFLEELTNF